MQNIFKEVATLDQRCYDQFFLNEDLLMEHAAGGIAAFIRKKFPPKSKVVVVSGSGNNGADVLVVARLLHKEYAVSIFELKPPSSPMAQLQHKRNQTLQIPKTQTLDGADVIVDGIVGTGFHTQFTPQIATTINAINRSNSYIIACDIPSGLSHDGKVTNPTIKADTTLTMGALKLSLFSDMAKDFVGDIHVINLGVDRSIYEQDSRYKLLQYSDMKLPTRAIHNTHKGSFGHLGVVCGSKSGAAILSALSGLRFGAGLVTLIAKTPPQNMPPIVMSSSKLPKNTTAIACGMGLGDDYKDEELRGLLCSVSKKVLDADILHSPLIQEPDILKNAIITPHPKEFVSLLKQLDIADISIDQLQNNRVAYAQDFSKPTFLISFINLFKLSTSLAFSPP
jgi:hydroxyethylthiazole kinase-like uncharacterized protein yjeF